MQIMKFYRYERMYISTYRDTLSIELLWLLTHSTDMSLLEGLGSCYRCPYSRVIH